MLKAKMSLPVSNPHHIILKIKINFLMAQKLKKKIQFPNKSSRNRF